jgi:S-adenosylmethionine hydrolase
VTLPISFLSDYGQTDDFVGVCHGVMATLAPDARIIDLTHGIPRHDVRAGALVLRRALPFMPPGVHLAVVDPDVGGDRLPVALRTADEDRILVGPDNGLLMLAARRFDGAVEAVDLSRSAVRLEPTSATFHGRDIFAPAAAALARGAQLAEVGEPIDPDALIELDMPLARPEDGELVARAVTVDHFGNVALDVEHEELAAFGLRLGRPLLVNGASCFYATTFADVAVGALLVYQDAYRTLALAINRGSVAEQLGLAVDDEVRLRPAP